MNILSNISDTFFSSKTRELFQPGFIQIFFRNCDATLIILLILRWIGIWDFAPGFLENAKEKVPIVFSENLFTSGRITIYFFIFLVIHYLISIFSNLLIRSNTEQRTMDDPESNFFKITPLLWIADDIVESASYICFFIFLVIVLTSGSNSKPTISIMLITCQILYDIFSFNYPTLRETLTKGLITNKKNDDNKSNRK